MNSVRETPPDLLSQRPLQRPPLWNVSSDHGLERTRPKAGLGGGLSRVEREVFMSHAEMSQGDMGCFKYESQVTAAH